MVIIADSSCLIALLSINRLELLRQVYGQVTTTPIVRAEVGKPLPDWIEIRAANNSEKEQEFRKRLDPGEASALALAVEIPNSLIILDDLPARKVAFHLKQPVTGTLGVLRRAKENGLIPLLKPLIEELRQVNFRVAESIELRVLREVGEL